MEMDLDLEEIILYLNANEPTGKYCKNIENLKNALIELKSIKEANPSEALECLDNLENSLSLANELLRVTDTSAMDKYIATIKQALLKAQEQKKALEIIKEKNVRIDSVKYYDLEEYNQIYENKLTQEEYYLLKEMLK
jgi:hypothetical protein